jgi:hypothetical protein
MCLSFHIHTCILNVPFNIVKCGIPGHQFIPILHIPPFSKNTISNNIQSASITWWLDFQKPISPFLHHQNSRPSEADSGYQNMAPARQLCCRIPWEYRETFPSPVDPEGTLADMMSTNFWEQLNKRFLSPPNTHSPLGKMNKQKPLTNRGRYQKVKPYDSKSKITLEPSFGYFLPHLAKNNSGLVCHVGFPQIQLVQVMPASLITV